jgi:hypothetical protein
VCFGLGVCFGFGGAFVVDVRGDGLTVGAGEVASWGAWLPDAPHWARTATRTVTTANGRMSIVGIVRGPAMGIHRLRHAPTSRRPLAAGLGATYGLRPTFVDGRGPTGAARHGGKAIAGYPSDRSR